MTLSTAGDKTVATENGSIEDQIATFVNAAVAHAETTDGDEDILDSMKAVGEELIDTLEDATIVEEAHVADSDRQDSGQDQQDDSDERGHTVHTVAVERVLLEYGMSGEQVDALIETIETVDSEVWGDDDE